MKTRLLLAGAAVVAAAPGIHASILQPAQLPDSLTASMSNRERHVAEITNNTKFVFGGEYDPSISPTDSAVNLLNTFYIDQYRQFHDPDAPYFMFMTRDAQLALGVGGKVMLRGWFDWNGYQPGYEFFPYDIAVPADPTERRGLGASASQTSVFFTLLGHHKKIEYMVYIQAAAKASQIVLKKAYVKLNDFTLGLTSSTFEDGASLVPTVDAEGPNGQIGKTQMLARYFHTFKSGWSVGGGVEFPSSDQSAVAGQTAACRDYIPDVVGLVQYGWGGGDSHIRLSGLLRNMAYRDLLTSSNHNVTGWGAQLSGVVNVVKPLTLYFSGVIGKGIGSYVGDLAEGNYDLVGSSASPGKMVAPLNLGVTAGIRYDFTDRLFACIGFGEARNFEQNVLSGDDYKYGLYGNVNLFWKVSPRFLAGIEYITGKRMNFSGKHAGSNRLDAMLSFSF